MLCSNDSLSEEMIDDEEDDSSDVDENLSCDCNTDVSAVGGPYYPHSHRYYSDLTKTCRCISPILYWFANAASFKPTEESP
jgi:hypothetical protein